MSSIFKNLDDRLAEWFQLQDESHGFDISKTNIFVIRILVRGLVVVTERIYFLNMFRHLNFIVHNFIVF